MQEIEALKKKIQIVNEFKEFLEWKLDRAIDNREKRKANVINKVLDDEELDFIFDLSKLEF